MNDRLEDAINRPVEEALRQADLNPWYDPFGLFTKEENMEGTLEELQAMSQEQLVGVIVLLRREAAVAYRLNSRLRTCLDAVRHPDVRARSTEIVRELKHMDGEHWAVGELLERVGVFLDDMGEQYDAVDETEG